MMEHHVYTALFTVMYNDLPVVQGAMGFSVNYSVEELKSDGKLLQKTVESINGTISSNIDVPMDCIIVFIPELVS